jgi:hypothetical protein
MTASGRFWTAARDFRLRQLRLEGATWAEIAEALRVGAPVAAARAAQIGAERSPAGSLANEDPEREPLPVGHPRAWSVLTEGTWLAGTRYPWSAGGEKE